MITHSYHQMDAQFIIPQNRSNSGFVLTARRQEIIKMTEQLIEAINNGDFDAYT